MCVKSALSFVAVEVCARKGVAHRFLFFSIDSGGLRDHSCDILRCEVHSDGVLSLHTCAHRFCSLRHEDACIRCDVDLSRGGGVPHLCWLHWQDRQDWIPHRQTMDAHFTPPRPVRRNRSTLAALRRIIHSLLTGQRHQLARGG